MELNFTPLSSLVVFSINVIGVTLIFTVIANKIDNFLKYIFTFMTILMFVWVDLAFLARGISDSGLSLLFIRIAWSITPMVFLLIFSFITHFLGIERRHLKTVRLYYLLAAFFFFITLYTGTIIENIEFVDGVLNIVYGPLVWFFFGVITFFTIINFYILIKERLDKSYPEEVIHKINYLLIGLTIFFVANAIFNITYPVFLRNFELYEFGDYSLIIFLSIIAFVTVTRGFFGMRVVASAFLVTLLLSTLFVDAVLLSSGINQRLIKLAVFLLVMPFGYLLLKSILTGVRQREQLENLTTKLKELDSKKNEFLNVAAHELRAPMTAIKGYLSMIENGDGGELPEEAGQYMREAIVENDRLIRLVNNMLNVSRIEEGRLVFEMGEVHLSEVVRRVYKQYESNAANKGLYYHLEIDDFANDLVSVDVDRIHEVMDNLISNAIKYTDSGSVNVKLFNRDESTVRVEVTDTGPGLSEDEQVKLFQKFYRAESNIGKKMGTGLGLYIARLLIDHFGGTISLNSKKGEGTTFWFELPVVEAKHRL